MSARKGLEATALIADDDPDTLNILSIFLKRLGIETVTATTAIEFREKFATHKPRLCLIDLNLGAPAIGFQLINEIRAEEHALAAQPALLVIISAESDAHSIAHAVELGASDYLVKPIDHDLLASKLASLLDSELLNKVEPTYFRLPGNGAAASLALDLRVEELDDLGIKITSSHLLGRGATLILGGPIISEILGNNSTVRTTVALTWAAPDRKSYGAYLEFPLEDEALVARLRSWISKHGLPVFNT